MTGCVWDILVGGYSKNPEATALTVCEEPAHRFEELTVPRTQGHAEPDEAGCLSWSYRQLLVACQRVSKFLLAKGVERGSTVLLFVPNGVEWPLMLWVALNLQFTFVPVDHRLLTEILKGQALELIEKYKPGLVVTDTLERAELLDGILKNSITSATTRLTFSISKPNQQWHGYQDIVGAKLYPYGNVSTNELPQDPKLDRGGDRVQYIYHTSGTTGSRPKGCPGRVEMVLSGILTDYGGRGVTLGMSAPRILMVIPNFRVVPWANALKAWKNGGSTVFACSQPSWTAIVESMERFDRLCMVIFPTFTPNLDAGSETTGKVFPKVRDVAIGGDIVTLECITAARRIFPNANVRTGHGMTEGGGVFDFDPSISGPGSGSLPSWGGIVTLGVPGPNASIRILDANGETVKRGEVGDLHISAPQLVTYYIDDVFPETFYKHEGRNWLVTGDRGVVDEKGRVYIIGRTKDVIKWGALSLSPSIPESILNKHEGIEVSRQDRVFITF